MRLMLALLVRLGLWLSAMGVVFILLARLIGGVSQRTDAVAVPMYDYPYSLLVMDMDRRVTYHISQDALMSLSLDIHPQDVQKIAYTDLGDGNWDIYRL